MGPEELPLAGDDLLLRPNAYNPWHMAGNNVCSTWKRGRDEEPFPCRREAVLLLGEVGMPYTLHSCIPSGCLEWRFPTYHTAAVARGELCAAVEAEAGLLVLSLRAPQGIRTRRYDWRVPEPKKLPTKLIICGLLAVIVYVLVQGLAQ